MADETVATPIGGTLPQNFACTVNGLPVVITSGAEFVIPEAINTDQAAELCHIHQLPGNFNHFNEDLNVHVVYAGKDAARVEISPQEMAAATEVAPVDEGAVIVANGNARWTIDIEEVPTDPAPPEAPEAPAEPEAPAAPETPAEPTVPEAPASE